jgi:hypothetical protein
VLHAKGFVAVFDDRVLVVTDWKENNYLRSDRYQPSKYLEIYKQELALLAQQSANDVLGIPDVHQMDTQVRLGKVRLGEVKDTDSVPYSPEFLTFWEAYPKKTGKGEAWKSCQRLRPSKSLAETITGAVRQQAGSNKAWKREEGRFIPNPATFLNQRRWEDEVTATAVTKKYANL